MALFEARESQIGLRPKRYSESTYLYYRDSDRPGVSMIRELLEAWFGEIQPEDRLDLQQRFRSPIQRQHSAALFELYLHHLLITSGYTVEFHPLVEDKTTRPDFLASVEGIPSFYVEAVTTGQSKTSEAEENRINLVYDTLNSLGSPDFYLSVRIHGVPATPPPGAKLRRDLKHWLSTLDWANISSLYVAKEFDSIPFYEWEHDGWHVVFEPIPKGPSKRGTTSARAIGATVPRARWVAHDIWVKESISLKNRYGKLSLPLLVALQVDDEFPIDEYDVLNGLFGQEVLTVRRDGQTFPGRKPNGAWTSVDGPQNRTVSAAAIWSTLVPWNFASIEPIMVHNPWAKNALSTDALTISQRIVNNDTIEVLPGQCIAQALRLPEIWPPPTD